MAHIRLNAHFDAPIERVFELGSHFSRYPEWDVLCAEFIEMTGPSDTIGTKVHMVGQLLGRNMDDRLDVHLDLPVGARACGRSRAQVPGHLCQPWTGTCGA